MRDDESINLSEKQQLLLSAYADDQCSFFSRFLAERLIRVNPDARTFISNLQATSTLFQEHAPNRDISVDLWARIDQRIDAEERAALYLGQRKALPEREAASLFDRLASKHALFGGLSCLDLPDPGRSCRYTLEGLLPLKVALHFIRPRLRRTLRAYFHHAQPWK
jgi:hypothetical protein